MSFLTATFTSCLDSFVRLDLHHERAITTILKFGNNFQRGKSFPVFPFPFQCFPMPVGILVYHRVLIVGKAVGSAFRFCITSFIFSGLTETLCFLHPYHLNGTSPSVWVSHCTSVTAALEYKLEITESCCCFLNKVLLAFSHPSLRMCCLWLLCFLLQWESCWQRPSGPQSWKCWVSGPFTG